MEPLHEDEPYLDPNVPGFVEDGERFERPAAVMVAAMLFAAGTPLSWVSVLTAILMLMIWISIGNQDHDDTI